MSMTIDEIRAERKALEETLFDLFESFQDKTKCMVDSVDVSAADLTRCDDESQVWRLDRVTVHICIGLDR